MNRSMLSRVSMPLLVSACLTVSFPAQAAPGWDIVGLRLGMTVPEARAALTAHAPKARVTEYTRSFSYTDGAKQLQSPAFLSSVTANVEARNQPADQIEVMFSAPPMEQRVIRVIRTVSTINDPVALDRATASVTQKYGKPERVFDANGRGSILRWNEPGKTPCGDNSNTSAEARLAPSVDNAPNGLGFYEVWKKRKHAPADASACAGALVVQLVTYVGQTSVNEMKFTMTDPGYAVPAMQATGKQIADLEAKARAARQQGGTLPKL